MTSAEERDSQIRKCMRYLQEAYRELENLEKFSGCIYNTQTGKATDFRLECKYGGDSLGKHTASLSLGDLGYECSNVLYNHLKRRHNSIIRRQTARLKELLKDVDPDKDFLERFPDLGDGEAVTDFAIEDPGDGN